MSVYDPAVDPPLICNGCGKTPNEFWVYSVAYHGEDITNDQYVWREEGTLNKSNGHFLCDACYINAGQPSSREGWKAP